MCRLEKNFATPRGSGQSGISFAMPKADACEVVGDVDHEERLT